MIPLSTLSDTSAFILDRLSSEIQTSGINDEMPLHERCNSQGVPIDEVVRERERKKRSHRDDSISQLVELMREEKKYRHDMQYHILDMMKQRNDAIEQYTMKTDSITQQFNEIKELLNQVLKNNKYTNCVCSSNAISDDILISEIISYSN